MWVVVLSALAAASGNSYVPQWLFGINIDPRNDQANPSAEQVKSLGATSLRVEIKIENDDVNTSLSYYDRELSKYINAGIGLLLTIDYQTTSQDLYNPWSNYVSTFAKRAGLIAARYPADGYEIWNEEDLCAGGYCPKLDVHNYTELLRAAAKAIHVARPQANVVVGGLASGQWETYAKSIVDLMGGDYKEVDGFGIHPYTWWPNNPTGNDLQYILRRLHDITNRPLWLTEWGDSTRQSACVDAYFKFYADPKNAELTSFIGAAHLFAWSSAQEGPGTEYGVVGRDGKKTQTWTNFQAAANVSTLTSRLHGTVTGGGVRLRGLLVSAWGHDQGDMHETTTDGSGVYVLEGLRPTEQYNMVVNARFDGSSYVVIDRNHDWTVRNNVVLISGSDGWHGEEFPLSR